jgi:hypothetical protein
LEQRRTSEERTWGCEMEWGDVLLLEFAHIVQEYAGKPKKEWQDRWGYANKPQRYDQWYVESDGTIRNTNGTHSMVSYLDPKTGQMRSANRAKNGSRRYWQGVELISPVTKMSELKGRLEEFAHLRDIAVEMGAVADPALRHACHIHVGIADFDLDDIKSLMRLAYASQAEMEEKFMLVEANSDIPVHWWKIADVERLCGTESVESMFLEYRRRRNTIAEPAHFAYKRVVNPSQWFKWKCGIADGIPTVEFRPFYSTLDMATLETYVRYSVELIERAKREGIGEKE